LASKSALRGSSWQLLPAVPAGIATIVLGDGGRAGALSFYGILGSLHTGPVKTRAGSRDLPIPSLARAALVIRQHKQRRSET